MNAGPSVTINQCETLPRFNPTLQLGDAATLKTIMCEETARRCAQQYGERLQAIVLTGSLARDEATFVAEAGYWRLLGDGEFLLIFQKSFELPSAADVDKVCTDIEEGLLRQKMRCHVSLSASHPTYLQYLRPHIFAFELRSCGQVIWGEQWILSLIPAFTASDIPLEDAWRLLCNRMIELLEALGEMTGTVTTPSLSAQYRTIKLYLDMATSYLVFAGAYEPTYRGRADKLMMLAESVPAADNAPFPLLDFAERVLACTRVKLLGPDAISASAAQERDGSGFGSWTEAVAYAERLWRWELLRLTGLSEHLTNQGLRKGWMRRQPLHNRLRGWFYVLRRQAWHRSWRDWPRWGRRAWRASPRYWIYAAASELFFKLPRLVVSDGPRVESDLDWEERRLWLPVVCERSLDDGRPAWRNLASEIVWNYHEFLEGTRA